jgi:hypothetical protein
LPGPAANETLSVDNKLGWSWELTFHGEKLMSFFVKPTQDGIVLGFGGRDLGDVHLTIYSKDGKIFAHITDKTRPDKPWSQYFDPKLLGLKAERAMRRWVRPYSRNKSAWVMTPFLRRKIRSVFHQKEGRLVMPLEATSAKLVFDRDNLRRWRKVRVNHLLTSPYGPGLTKVDGKLQWVVPLDGNRMLAFTDRQFERYWKMVFRELGLDKYLDYATSFHPDWIATVRGKVRKISVKGSPLDVAM